MIESRVEVVLEPAEACRIELNTAAAAAEAFNVSGQRLRRGKLAEAPKSSVWFMLEMLMFSAYSPLSYGCTMLNSLNPLATDVQGNRSYHEPAVVAINNRLLLV